MKGLRAACMVSLILLAGAGSLFGQTPTPTTTPTPPPWSDFAYTDWNPGISPAIDGDTNNRHYEARTVWDGTQFVNIHEQLRTPTPPPNYYSLWIAKSSDGRTWTTPTPIDVPRDWDIGHHTVACNPDGFPYSDIQPTRTPGLTIKYKMWYAAYGDNYRYRYAESEDGVAWIPALEYDYCPPFYKASNFDPGECGTTQIMIKPDVLYRPGGSETLDTANPMNNRYIMYLGSNHTSWCNGDPGYFEMYISSNGLDDWTLYAWDQQCQDRWDGRPTPPGGWGTTPTPTPEVKDILTFAGGSNPSSSQYVNAIEEVYEKGERQGFMLWTDNYTSPIYSYYSTDGVNWYCREEPINTIGKTNPTPGAWNNARNYNFDSVRLGESYFITRSGYYNTGGAIVKGNISAEVDTPSSPAGEDVTINYTLYRWAPTPVPTVGFDYSTNAGSAWNPATRAGGDTSPYETGIGGYGHTFVWDSGTDLPGGANSVLFRVWPDPLGTPGSYDTTGSFSVVQPTPTTTATPSVTPTRTSTATPSPTMSPTATPSASPTGTPTSSPSSTPSNTPTITPTPTITSTPTITPTAVPRLAIMKKEGANDTNLYYYNGLTEGDWVYWDALARNPSAYARDFWVIPVGNNAVGMAAVPGAGPDRLYVLKQEGANDVNLYLYESLLGGDWVYWDALARNPSAMARDLWAIPVGNDAIGMAAIDITGDQTEELAILKKEGASDMNIYYYNGLAIGDWVYWDALARNPSPLARDLWSIPVGNDAVGLAVIDIDSGEKELAIIRKEGVNDLNLYFYNNLVEGDWTYWDAVARNPSPLARDLWAVPVGNDAIGMAAIDATGDTQEELAILKKEGAGDVNIYYYNTLVPGDWVYWDAFARNPSPLARDLWAIPIGNDAVGMAAVRTNP